MTLTSHLARTGRFHSALWPAWWVVMCVLTHLPKLPTPPVHIAQADKFVHFAMYFVLTLLGGRALMAAGRIRGLPTLVGWAGVYLAYGALDEWTQRFVHRTPSFNDWLADAVGVSVATLILSTFPPRTSEPEDPPSDPVATPGGAPDGDERSLTP